MLLLFEISENPTQPPHEKKYCKILKFYISHHSPIRLSVSNDALLLDLRDLWQGGGECVGPHNPHDWKSLLEGNQAEVLRAVRLHHRPVHLVQQELQ